VPGVSKETPEVHETLPLDLARRLDPVCDRFEDAWLARPRIEDFLEDLPEPDRPALLRELLWLDLDYRGRNGERPLAEEYRRRLPGYAALIDAVFGTDALPVPLAEAAVSRATGPQTPAPPVWPAIAGYEVLGELGQGGMGVARSTSTESSLSR
jgi:hypothetical protein